jgi:putative FmdB family regulatory protein
VPTYSYACTECSNRFDAVQAFTDDALTECPECSGRLRKLFGSVGVVFKGSGFYRTDSRAASNGSSDGATKESSTDSSSDKPAAKSNGESKSNGASKPGGESKPSTTTPATAAS